MVPATLRPSTQPHRWPHCYPVLRLLRHRLRWHDKTLLDVACVKAWRRLGRLGRRKGAAPTSRPMRYPLSQTSQAAACMTDKASSASAQFRKVVLQIFFHHTRVGNHTTEEILVSW